MELIDKLFSIIYGTEHTKLSVGRKISLQLLMVVKLVWNAVWWLVNTNFRFLYMFSVENLPMLNDVERSLGQGNILTGMCLSTGGVSALGGCLVWGGYLVGGACSRGGVACSQGVPGLVGAVPGGCLVETPRMATAAGGTHPTGMHSCHLQWVLCQ